MTKALNFKIPATDTCEKNEKDILVAMFNVKYSIPELLNLKQYVNDYPLPQQELTRFFFFFSSLEKNFNCLHTHNKLSGKC